ncbi:MAG: fluoride efflux transporter CrcB [Pseudomonadota bacterium]
MLNIIFIACGGAIGALCRYGMSVGAQQLLGKGFPYGTLLVNVIGSLLIGVVYVLMIERAELSQEWRSFIIIGVLGAFTTFSTFSFETITLFESGDTSKALINIFVSVFSCLFVCWVGMFLTRQTTI